MNPRPSSALHQGAFYVFISAAGFSMKAIFAKKAYESGADPVQLLFLRLLFAAPLFLLLATWNRRNNTDQQGLTRQELLLLLALGIGGYYLSSLTDFIGLSYLSASLERVILFTYPTLVVLITALFFGSSLAAKDYLALSITYAGIVLVFYEELGQSTHLSTPDFITGAALIFASALTYAFYLIGSGFLIPRIGPARFTAYSVLIATAAISVQFFSRPGHGIAGLQDTVLGYGLAMAVFCTFMPSYFLSKGIQLIGSERSAVISTIGPVSTILLANLILGESMTWLQIAGTFVVIGGVLMISLKTHKPATNDKR